MQIGIVLRLKQAQAGLLISKEFSRTVRRLFALSVTTPKALSQREFLHSLIYSGLPIMLMAPT